MKRHACLLATALLLSGCSASTPAQGPVPRSAPSRTALADGCAGTPLLRGAPPAWNPRPAGFTEEPDLPYVLGRRGTAMGYIFNAPLVAPPRAGKNKILWYVRQPRNGSPHHRPSRRGGPSRGDTAIPGRFLSWGDIPDRRRGPAPRMLGLYPDLGRP